ncbi:MAG: hypothetical protein HRU23_09755 [Gammaproteobacteria bacterium]|nr:hypothetical protein [Gammaproteobacteria bacterium]
MNIDQISSAVINSLQMILEQQGLDLKVGPISDHDYRILTSGYAELEWGWGFGQFGNSDDKFEFTVKIQQDGVPDGAMLGEYDFNEKTLEIQFIESFIRDNENHPLNGRMVMITLIASLLFISATDGDAVEIVGPTTKKLIDYYCGFGFSRVENSEPTLRLKISKDDLELAVKKFS